MYWDVEEEPTYIGLCHPVARSNLRRQVAHVLVAECRWLRHSLVERSAVDYQAQPGGLRLHREGKYPSQCVPVHLANDAQLDVSVDLPRLRDSREPSNHTGRFCGKILYDLGAMSLCFYHALYIVNDLYDAFTACQGSFEFFRHRIFHDEK